MTQDPRDLYPVFVPAKGRITVRTTAAGAVDLALWSRNTPTVTEASPGKDRLATSTTKGSTETATYRNSGSASWPTWP